MSRRISTGSYSVTSGSSSRRFTSSRGRPAGRTVQVALQVPPEQFLEPQRDVDERGEVDPRANAVALELPHEVLGCDVAGRVRGERAAAEAGDRRVEHRGAA